MDSWLVTSRGWKFTLWSPWLFKDSRASSPRVASRAVSTTVIPSFANWRTISKAIRLLAPVTTATVSLDHHLKHFRESTQLREHVQEKIEAVDCRSEDHTLWKLLHEYWGPLNIPYLSGSFAMLCSWNLVTFLDSWNRTTVNVFKWIDSVVKLWKIYVCLHIEQVPHETLPHETLLLTPDFFPFTWPLSVNRSWSPWRTMNRSTYLQTSKWG